jgi:hypothetical protein
MMGKVRVAGAQDDDKIRKAWGGVDDSAMEDGAMRREDCKRTIIFLQR